MTMMKCGHSANGKRKIGNIWTDCCLICIGLDPKAKIIDEAPPDLNERKARCSYFDSIPKGRNHESNYGCKRGNPCLCEQSSSDKLPFFEHKPNNEYDKFYCGCWGWD
uniref:Uncharacterized protein n=1 Tax=viral metagenome TaxID=1070528 RepID=A0A6M3IUC1_9ZZZZ